MASHLNELDTDSLLVLYLAGELTNGDRAVLERRLANEPALAAELQRVREAQGFCTDAIGRADNVGRMPVSEGVAIRRVSRVIQQWQADRVREKPATLARRLPLPWWSYPVAAAAAIIIAFLVWSSRQSPIDRLTAENTTAPTEAEPPPELADWMDSSFGVNAEANAEDLFTSPDGLPVGADDPSSSSIFPTREETIQ
jgi:anti-sigma factor RsiW